MRLTRTVLLVSLLALVFVPAALAIRFTDDSYFFPTGVVGQPYSKQLNGAGGCGPALPYQYTLIGGNLPPGLSLSFSGLIGGVPSQAGSWSFWVNLSDQNPPSATWCRPAQAQREFTITVIPGAAQTPLTISQTSLTPKATVVGTAYSATPTPRPATRSTPYTAAARRPRPPASAITCPPKSHIPAAPPTVFVTMSDTLAIRPGTTPYWSSSTPTVVATTTLRRTGSHKRTRAIAHPSGANSTTFARASASAYSPQVKH